MPGVLDVLRTIALVVGAGVLYCLMMALLWAAVVGLVRRAGRSGLGPLRRAVRQVPGAGAPAPSAPPGGLGGVARVDVPGPDPRP